MSETDPVPSCRLTNRREKIAKLASCTPNRRLYHWRVISKVLKRPRERLPPVEGVRKRVMKEM